MRVRWPSLTICALEVESDRYLDHYVDGETVLGLILRCGKSKRGCLDSAKDPGETQHWLVSASGEALNTSSRGEYFR